VPSLLAGRATRWPSGWNVDRQKHDYEDQDRIKRDFRDVETPTPPLPVQLARSWSIFFGRKQIDHRRISVPPNGWPGPWGKPEMF